MPLSSSSSHAFVLMSRDRPHYLQHLISLFRFYGDSYTTLIISDNSSTAINRAAVKNIALKANCIYWQQTDLTVFAHYHKILTSTEFPYLTLIHDDDLILPGFINTVYSHIHQLKHLSVIGYNAFPFRSSSGSSDALSISISSRATLKEPRDLYIENPTQLLLRWISPFCNGIAPLSGCTFNLSLYDSDFFETYSSAELYFDTVLMILFSQRAPIKWVSTRPCILLHEHDTRLTSIATVHDEKLLVRTVTNLFPKDLFIRSISNFYLFSRSIRTPTTNYFTRTTNFAFYLFFLFCCILLWPHKLPRFVLNKLSSL